LLLTAWRNKFFGCFFMITRTDLIAASLRRFTFNPLFLAAGWRIIFALLVALLLWGCVFWAMGLGLKDLLP
jgi:hypothetical protein